MRLTQPPFLAADFAAATVTAIVWCLRVCTPSPASARGAVAPLARSPPRPSAGQTADFPVVSVSVSLSVGRTNFVFSRSVISDPVASSGVSLVCEGGCGGDLSVVCCSVRLKLPRERTRTEASSEEEAVGVSPSRC